MVLGRHQLVNVTVERLAFDPTGDIAPTIGANEGEGPGFLGLLNGTSTGANETTVE